MNRKGFTLVELLVVIAIVAILSILVIPNILSINRNINERLYSEKQDEAVNAAQLYASDNEGIFNGKQTVNVYIGELIEKGYLTTDVKVADGSNCDNESKGDTNKGCMIDPRNNVSMNNDYIILTREALGVIGEYQCVGDHCDSTPTGDTGPRTLVKAVCDDISSGKLTAKSYGGGDCKCIAEDGEYRTLTGGASACIISGQDPNNYLRYGSDKANWRVLGVYVVNGKLSAKIITESVVN